jgi:hypothetical protein
MPLASIVADRTGTAAASGAAGLSGALAKVVAILGLLAVLIWACYRFGPTIARVAGIAVWWTAWACGSQGAFAYMAALFVLGTVSWVAGTVWYARRRGHWPSPLSARLLGRRSARPHQ